MDNNNLKQKTTAKRRLVDDLNTAVPSTSSGNSPKRLKKMLQLTMKTKEITLLRLVSKVNTILILITNKTQRR